MYEINRNMNEGLHVLRGLAAVSVIFYHAAHMPPYSDVGALTLFHEFGAGVTLFFLLSGFSLTLSNISKVERPNWIGSYTLKRFFRIAPLWWFMIAVTLGFHYLEYGKLYSLGEIARNVVPIFGLSPSHHESIVWAGWTIGVEVIFYAVFPLLLATFKRNIIAWIGLTLAAGLISVSFVMGLPEGIPESYKYMAFARQFVVFCIGVLLFLLIERVPAEHLSRARQLSLLVAIGLIYAWSVQHLSPGRNIIGDPVIFKAVALGAVVLAFYSARSFLFNPVTKFWGDASYGIYLIHPIIVHKTKFLYAWLAEQIPIVELAFLAYVAIVLAIVCLLAKFVHSLLEEPLYRYGRKLANRPSSDQQTEKRSESAHAQLAQ